MNESGQAYSTFKLLIAAIVAMAILAILIPIIMTAMGWLTASPLNETKSLLNDLVGSPGALKHTPAVAFKPDDVLAASALAETLPISQDQICMSLGEFDEDDERGFECIGCGGSEDQHRIVYHGVSNQTAKIGVVCNVNLDNLEEDIEAYNLDDEGNLDCTICEGKGKCCAIILRRSG